MFKECKRWGLRLWECPPFLVLVMGFFTIVSMVLTALVTTRYFEEPEGPTVIAVSLVAAVFMAVGHLIIGGFNKIVEANRMKAEFISLASHQLRTPLSIFKWTLDLLSSELLKKIELGNLDGEVDTLLHSLGDSTERMVKLLNSLLDVNRIDAGTMALSMGPVSLEEITRKEMGNFKDLSSASNVEINFTCQPSLPKVMADRARLAAVVDNLIDNAVRYTTGSGKVLIKIEKEGDKRVRWSISDQGLGIPRSQRGKIFGKFFRAENIKEERTTGSGLGLYIAKSFIKMFGGKIGFESEEGKGTTFWFTLAVAGNQQ